MTYFTIIIGLSQFLHPLLLCSKWACLPHGSHPMCPLLMASVVIEFDEAHLQPNKRAVCKNPNSPIQRYQYFTGGIIKLNNPFWLEAKWRNSSQRPRLNHKQKAFWCFMLFQSVSWLQQCNNDRWTWNLSWDRSYTMASWKCMSVFVLQWSVLSLQWSQLKMLQHFAATFRQTFLPQYSLLTSMLVPVHIR